MVGHLAEADRGRVSFRLIDDYRNLVHRPILSQSFEDDLAKVYRAKVYRGKPNELPPFFANLMPPGHVAALRDYWERAPLLKRHSDWLH